MRRPWLGAAAPPRKAAILNHCAGHEAKTFRLDVAARHRSTHNRHIADAPPRSRVMKQHWVPHSRRPARATVADHQATQRAASSTSNTAADALLGSARLLAQRQVLQARFGLHALQRSAIEEEPLQGRGLALQLASLEEEEPLQGQGLLQRAAPEEEELLQGRGIALQRQSVEEEEPLQGKGLPPALAAGVQQLSGADMSDVRVHAGSPQPAQVGALAFAQGNDIHLAPGQERHLPHEAWHVVQQRQGRVQATVQAAGVLINDNPGLEAEADRMGARAVEVGQRASARQPRRA
jgi:hypothetical protein